MKNELKLEKQIIVGIFLKQYDHKKNNVALLLGKHVLVNTFIKSPYLSLRNDILSHPNLVEKQLYIIRLVEKYTRYFILGDINRKIRKQSFKKTIFGFIIFNPKLPYYLFFTIVDWFPNKDE